jgi:hypothetical protein
MYYRSAHAAVVVYDITSAVSPPSFSLPSRLQIVGEPPS